MLKKGQEGKYLTFVFNLDVLCFFSLVAQLCLTLCDPMDRSLPGSSVHGILQARILEWVAIPFFKKMVKKILKLLNLEQYKVAHGI